MFYLKTVIFKKQKMFFYEFWLNLPFEGMKKFSKMNIFKVGKSGQSN